MIDRIFKRVNNSLAYRIAVVYQFILRYVLPEPRLAAKPQLEVGLLTMCGKKHLLMLETSLYSIARFWSKLPKLTVVGDGTVSNDVIRRRLRWWPGELAVVSWSDYNAHHLARGRQALVDYATKNGFGRKLSAVLAEAEQRRVLWCDTDIIFYQDFVREVELEEISPPIIDSTLDWCYGYDTALTKGKLKFLLNLPPVNTGIMMVEGSFYEKYEFGDLIKQSLATCNGFTEQTILAVAVHGSGAIRWPLERVDISEDDKFSLRPTFGRRPCKIRHYVTPIRHVFWRDAFFLRLCKQASISDK